MWPFSTFSFSKKQLRYSAVVLGLFVIIPLLVFLTLFLFVRFSSLGNIPTNSMLSEIKNPVASTMYAENGKVIGKIYKENRGNLKYNDIPPHLIQALIATEDARFYNHSGIDYKSMARVLFKTVLMQKRSSGGGSTLHQQLAKNMYPRERYRCFSLIINKMREMIIARKLDKLYSDEELVLLYLNTIPFGEKAFGLHTAAQRFFNKLPQQLNLEESAVLVGLLKATSYYNPRNHPERAKQRRNIVLKQMLRYGYITTEEAEIAKNKPLKLDYQPLASLIGLGKYFQQHVKSEFEQWAKKNPKSDGTTYNIYTDGLKIYTSLDYRMQAVAEAAMMHHMKSLQKAFLKSWKNNHLYGKNQYILTEAIKKSPAYKNSTHSSHANKIKQLKKKKIQTYWTWDGVVKDSLSTIDSIKNVLHQLHCGVLALDPNSGYIKTYVGGIDFDYFPWDQIQSPRQVGSTFKPVVYLTGFRKGAEPCSYFPNELRTYTDLKDWTPKNANNKYGGYLSASEALTHSVNTVSVQMLFKAGIPSVLETAKDMGITSKIPEVPSIVLGTADISLLEIVKAYGYLANGGNTLDAKCITKIVDASGNILFEYEPFPPKEEIEIDSAILKLNTILAKVTERGTATRLYSQFDIPFNVMGKTGTTQNQSDGWFVSYTSDLVIGSWVGTSDRRIHFKNLYTGSGGRSALPLVGAIWEHKGATNYRPSKSITCDLEFCIDSLTNEQFALLGDNPENRYDKILGKPSESILVSILDDVFTKRPKQTRPLPNYRHKNSKRKKQNHYKRKMKQRKRSKNYNEIKEGINNFLRDLEKTLGDN